MTKKRISVQIEGRNYTLITSEDSRYVQGVAEEVTRQIRCAAQQIKQLDTRDCAVLAALNLCDDRNKAKKRNKELVAKADQIITQVNDLNRLCAEYKEKLTEAINENTRITRRVKALEAQLAQLSQDNEILKKAKSADEAEEMLAAKKAEQEQKNAKLMGYVPMCQCSLFDEDFQTEAQPEPKAAEPAKPQPQSKKRKKHR